MFLPLLFALQLSLGQASFAAATPAPATLAPATFAPATFAPAGSVPTLRSQIQEQEAEEAVTGPYGQEESFPQEPALPVSTVPS